MTHLTIDETPEFSCPPAQCWEVDWPVRLCVLHVGKSFVVIEKVAGMLSVPGRGEHKRDSVTTRMFEIFPDATGPVLARARAGDGQANKAHTHRLQ